MKRNELRDSWSPQQADFNEVLLEQLKRAPWFMISLVVHAAAILVLLNVSFADIAKDTRSSVEARLETLPIEKLEEVPEPIVEEDPVEEEPIQDPDVEQAENDDDVATDEAESEDDSTPDQPYEGKESNDIIGIGGGLAGPWGSRGGGGERGGPRGGGHGVAAPLQRGLDWLARHQVKDAGFWDADGFQSECKGDICDGRGYPLYDPGITGLALLAFLGAGHTHATGPYKETVAAGLKYLKRIQDPEGCFGTQSGHYMYSHACCTLAMAEAFGMTRSVLLRRSVEKAVAFLLKAQNPNPAGTGKLAWRYTMQPGDNDTSVTGWVIMALKSARMAGLEVPQSAFEGARIWVEQMTDPATGRVGYVQNGVSPVRAPGREENWPRGKSESTTAVAMLTRVFIGEDPDRSPALQKGASLCLERLPGWNRGDGSIDQYYWYYGTLAMFQMGGPGWRKWNRAMKKAIVESQCKDGCARGSWDPIGPWGEDGGRVYSTALMTMCLEVYYRYPRVFGTR